MIYFFVALFGTDAVCILIHEMLKGNKMNKYSRQGGLRGERTIKTQGKVMWPSSGVISSLKAKKNFFG